MCHRGQGNGRQGGLKVTAKVDHDWFAGEAYCMKGKRHSFQPLVTDISPHNVHTFAGAGDKAASATQAAEHGADVEGKVGW